MDIHPNMGQSLTDMRAEAVIRLHEAQADIDAIDRVLVFCEKTQPSPVPASNEEIRLASIKVLTQHGEPVHRQTIYDVLLSMGIHVNGKDPVSSLGTVLSRCSTDFEPHGHGVWGLKEANPSPSHGDMRVETPPYDQVQLQSE